MKHISILSAAIAFVLFQFPSMAIAQEGIQGYSSFQEIKVDRKTLPEDIPGLLKGFLSGNGFSQVETGESFQRELKSFFFRREGKTKEVFTTVVDLSYEIVDKRVKLGFSFHDISRNRILCDRTQASSIEILSSSAISTDIKSRLEEIAQTYAVGIQEYLKKKSFFKIDLETDVPSWVLLPYIVESNAVSYYQVLQSENGFSKEQLYHIAENYFTYSYQNGKAVIQTRDPENCVIVGKATLSDVHVYYGFAGTEKYTVPFILRIECRDGRARAIITISDYEIHHVGGTMVPGWDFTRNVAHYIPFGTEDDEEMVECIDKLEPIFLSIFLEIKKAIDEGNTSVEAIDEW